MCILFQLFRPVDIGISQNEDHPPDPLLDRRDRKCLYTVFLQMCQNFIIPVAVGIGLDDRPEGAIADTLTKAGKIVLQRLNINFSVYGTGHSNTLLS